MWCGGLFGDLHEYISVEIYTRTLTQGQGTKGGLGATGEKRIPAKGGKKEKKPER